VSRPLGAVRSFRKRTAREAHRASSGLILRDLLRTVSPLLHRHPHQRCDDFPRASAHARFALRLAVACDARCVRPTSASHHIHYEHPRLGRFLDVDGQERSAFHDARLASAGDRTSVWGVLLPVSGLCTAPRMLPSRLSSARRISSRSADLLSRRQDRFGHAPRERRMAPTIRSTFRREVTSSSCLSRNRFRPRGTELAFCWFRDFAITTQRSALLRSGHSPHDPLSEILGSRPFARPRRRESSFG